MASIGVVRLTGKSGNQYAFKAFLLGTTFKKDLGAVYVLTRRRHVKPDGHFAHKQLQMGQTADLRLPLPDAAESAAKSGANCICVHPEKDEATRLGIQQDLVRPPSGWRSLEAAGTPGGWPFAGRTLLAGIFFRVRSRACPRKARAGPRPIPPQPHAQPRHWPGWRPALMHCHSRRTVFFLHLRLNSNRQGRHRGRQCV